MIVHNSAYTHEVRTVYQRYFSKERQRMWGWAHVMFGAGKFIFDVNEKENCLQWWFISEEDATVFRLTWIEYVTS